MNSLLDRMVNYILSNQVVSAEKEAWLRYGLEKRIYTLLVYIPFSILAVLLAGFWTAVFFMGSFFHLRSKTNGIHAKSAIACLFGSVLLELLFLGLFLPYLNEISIVTLIAISLIVVYLLAPYNHPNMNLTTEEYIACKKISRIRATQLAFLVVLLISCGLIEIAKGISLGYTMASALLGLAYISDWRIIEWKK